MRRAVVGLACCVMAVVVLVIALRMQRQASPAWTQFSIGPASGDSTSINTTALHANGVTLKVALATAYAMPPVRVIGPPWISSTRYSLNAAVGDDEVEKFRPLLQEELKKRLGLETHIEARPFEVFVLAAGDTPRLERSSGPGPSTWISKQDVRMRKVSMGDVASALQSILGRPVIDETGISGFYDMTFGWSEDRAASVTATLRDRFGLRLSPGTRNMDALIVDTIRRGPGLVLLEHIGRITRAAPAPVRRGIADILTMR